jgi:CheY-like chemotaxis protein
MGSITGVKEEIRLGTIKHCLKEKSILVVDNDTSWNHALTKLLEDLGANVNIAISGMDCIRLLRAASFDLILLDIRLPDINGWDVFAMLKHIPNGRQAPVLVLTGLSRADLTDNLACLPIPENQVLHKNSPPELILQAMYKILQA